MTSLLKAATRETVQCSTKKMNWSQSCVLNLHCNVTDRLKFHMLLHLTDDTESVTAVTVLSVPEAYTIRGNLSFILLGVDLLYI